MIEFLLAIIAILVPAVAASNEYLSRRREERERLEARKLEKEKFLHEQKLQATDRLTKWATKVALELSRADHFIAWIEGSEKTPLQEDLRFELASKISALIDEGRWLFPNHAIEGYGMEKHPINQGGRDHRLDSLVWMYRALCGDAAVEPQLFRKNYCHDIQQLAIPLSDHVHSP